MAQSTCMTELCLGDMGGVSGRGAGHEGAEASRALLTLLCSAQGHPGDPWRRPAGVSSSDPGGLAPCQDCLGLTARATEVH